MSVVSLDSLGFSGFSWVFKLLHATDTAD